MKERLSVEEQLRILGELENKCQTPWDDPDIPAMCYECKWYQRDGEWTGICTHPEFKGKRSRFSNSHACGLVEPKGGER